jgi:hypothetical protein
MRDRYVLPGSVAATALASSPMTSHDDIISRAHYKLVESCSLDAALHAVMRRAGPKRAVDVGAAPGGWSFLLARHGFHVLAIVRSISCSHALVPPVQKSPLCMCTPYLP